MSAVARQRVAVPVAVRGRLRTRRAIENVGRYAVLLLILAFAMFPFVWTLEGQYVFKDIILISAGLVIGATHRGGGLSAKRPIHL